MQKNDRQRPYFRHEDDCYDIGNAADVEKYGYSRRNPSPGYAEDHIPSSYSDSSRETSGSYAPMLHKSPAKKQERMYLYRLPHRAVRYCCLTLALTLVIFVLSLIRMSWASAKRLEMGPVEKTTSQPELWESFDFLKRYHGGIRTLVLKENSVPEWPRDVETGQHQESNASLSARDSTHLPKSIPFDPYPDYSSADYSSKYEAKHECFLDFKGHQRIPQVHHYTGIPQGFPDPAMGAHAVLGLRDDVCFERFGRLGPYGFGYSVNRGGIGAGLNGDREGADDLWTDEESLTEVDYSKIQWSDVQHVCAAKNGKRFQPLPKIHDTLFQAMGTKSDQEPSVNGEEASTKKREFSAEDLKPTNETKVMPPQRKTLLPRTAVLIRTWWNMQYSQEDIICIRSLIAELSLLSGGEYIVHFLIHVKDDNIPIWADKQIYDRILENALPEEFRGMGVLWSERQMGLIYGGLEESFFRQLPVHGVYRSTFMPVQYFSHQHPEYDFLWNWEMDVRYTGHWYHLLDRVRQWTKAQPRKGLWERNGRFYIPSVHGSWEDFKQMVRVQTEMGTDSSNNVWSGLKHDTPGMPPSPQGKTDKPVWGPLRPSDALDAQDDPNPPTTIEKDRYTWGVSEEADLITFSPLFDPDGTTWFFTNDVTGYNATEGLPPRRAAITTTSRLSRRLLQTMHREMFLKRHAMFSEAWPASVALHHGYKAVYAPHPVYIDRDWPPSYLAAVMNGGRNGATGGARTSVFGSREHNFKGTTWFYDAGFSPNLWRRWLGYKVDNDGGEQEELAGEGRMCLPGIFLHPVKGVDLVIEGARQVQES